MCASSPSRSLAAQPPPRAYCVRRMAAFASGVMPGSYRVGRLLSHLGVAGLRRLVPTVDRPQLAGLLVELKEALVGLPAGLAVLHAALECAVEAGAEPETVTDLVERQVADAGRLPTG